MISILISLIKKFWLNKNTYIKYNFNNEKCNKNSLNIDNFRIIGFVILI